MIQLQTATKIYPTRAGQIAAVENATLSVEAGEFVAIRGPSGCGKSTLLALVGGLTLPTSGTVRVAGETVSSMSAAQRARFRKEHVGFVFQLFHLLPYLSVLDNVLLAASAHARRDGVEERARELLDRFQLNDRLDHRPGQLSVGQRQRVAMARALLNRPQLLLADEPTGNLDQHSAEDVLDLLLQFQQEGGTILLVTHDDRAAERAQRSMLMERGLICEAQAAV